MAVLFCAFEMIKYIIAEYLFLGRKGKQLYIYIVGLVIYLIYVLMTNSPIEDKHMLVFVITLICFFITLDDRIGVRILYSFVIFVIVTALSGIEQFIYELMVSVGLVKLHTMIYFLIKDIASIVLLICGVAIKDYYGSSIMRRLRKTEDRFITFALAISVYVITFTISLVNYSQGIIFDKRYNEIALSTSGIAQVSIVTLVGLIVYIKAINVDIKRMSDNKARLDEMQIHNYKALLEKENETRAFRHDISNHLICLSSLAERGELSALVSYIDDMKMEIKRIKGKKYSTGNEILDIITNYYLPQLSDNIKIDVIPSEDVELKEMKICTIYSNLLQNAFEELNAYPEKEGHLLISMKYTNNTYRLLIENSVFSKKKNGLLTNKKDKRNHGYGLKNVENVVKELDGKLIINSGADCFQAIVELKLIHTV